MKKLYLILIITTISVFLTGCDDIQIFEDKEAKYQAKEYKKAELEEEKYYVKDGTSFYEIYDCESNSTSVELDVTKCAWTILDDKKLPNYYCNELIAFASGRKVEEHTLTMERYKDSGYSIGVYGAKFEDGYISFSYNNSVANDTDADKKFNNEYSKDILIESINDEPVTASMLNEAGVIIGMEAGKEYKISFFAGTYYGIASIKADTHFYQCFEMFKVDNYEMTKNGYMSIILPEDLKTGYYRLAGKGMFRYLAEKKGNIDIATANYNEPYYESEEDQMAVFSQQYVFQIDAITANMSVEATFDSNSVANSTGKVKMMVTSPDGKHMTVEAAKEDEIISCDMFESTPGQWIVNISPQSMTVNDVEVKSNQKAMEATKESYDIDIEHDMTGVVMTVTYEGEGNITAQIVDKDLKSYDMVQKNTTEKVLTYNFPYLGQGTYTVNVYHYPDTKINDVSYYLSEDVKDIEIIEIEE